MRIKYIRYGTVPALNCILHLQLPRRPGPLLPTLSGQCSGSPSLSQVRSCYLPSIWLLSSPSPLPGSQSATQFCRSSICVPPLLSPTHPPTPHSHSQSLRLFALSAGRSLSNKTTSAPSSTPTLSLFQFRSPFSCVRVRHFPSFDHNTIIIHDDDNDTITVTCPVAFRPPTSVLDHRPKVTLTISARSSTVVES